jgi:hypothetical protein
MLLMDWRTALPIYLPPRDGFRLSSFKEAVMRDVWYFFFFGTTHQIILGSLALVVEIRLFCLPSILNVSGRLKGLMSIEQTLVLIEKLGVCFKRVSQKRSGKNDVKPNIQDFIPFIPRLKVGI